jgi:hypothetical protein
MTMKKITRIVLSIFLSILMGIIAFLFFDFKTFQYYEQSYFPVVWLCYPDTQVSAGKYPLYMKHYLRYPVCPKEFLNP